MHALDRVLEELLGEPCEVADVRGVGGGCISEAMRVCAHVGHDKDRYLFLKRNEPSFQDNFDCEILGLRQLAETGTIRVPEPIASGVVQPHAWLVTEWIDEGRRDADFFPGFGRQLAELHRVTSGNEIGWFRNNYLGASCQVNAAADSWFDFFAQNRIGFQIRWAVDQGLADGGLVRDCDQIVNSMDELLSGRSDETSLIHGDLWSGNYLSDAEGHVVIIDPAVYRGCREAEFGMIRLFGSCPESFYASYQDTWPMPDGWQRRCSVYVLYHLLNHLNLFGTGYLGQCRQTAADVLAH